ncbi:MAG TPA: hypothetical protein VK505_10245, partial [Steroidobacteraceae bacterium]|nr:hypothetical protein [Steroidobacteraceae bacterium]
ATAGTLEAVLADAPLVQNRIPPGATWDGADEVDADALSYQQLLSERETKPPPVNDAQPTKPRG